MNSLLQRKKVLCLGFHKWFYQSVCYNPINFGMIFKQHSKALGFYITTSYVPPNMGSWQMCDLLSVIS